MFLLPFFVLALLIGGDFEASAQDLAGYPERKSFREASQIPSPPTIEIEVDYVVVDSRMLRPRIVSARALTGFEGGSSVDPSDGAYILDFWRITRSLVVVSASTPMFDPVRPLGFLRVDGKQENRASIVSRTAGAFLDAAVCFDAVGRLRIFKVTGWDEGNWRTLNQFPDCLQAGPIFQETVNEESMRDVGFATPEETANETRQGLWLAGASNSPFLCQVSETGDRYVVGLVRAAGSGLRGVRRSVMHDLANGVRSIARRESLKCRMAVRLTGSYTGGLIITRDDFEKVPFGNPSRIGQEWVGERDVERLIRLPNVIAWSPAPARK